MANSATQTQLSCPANASKKSYIKACQRAARDGVAKYRGLFLKPNELGMKEVSSIKMEEIPRQPAKKRSVLHKLPKEKFELEVLSWNIGGMTSRLFDELFSILDMPEYRKVRLVSIQETHWSTTGQFSKGNLHVVTSSMPTGRQAGVMTLVHKSLCTLADIRAREIQAGRLQHVRLPWQNSHVHVVTGYQHVWQSTLSTEQNNQQRQLWTGQLESCLKQIPQRDRLLVAADFNATAQRESPYIGPCARRQARLSQRPAKTINKICREFQLAALNTFSCRKPYTFQNGKSRTQIDFVLTRLRHAGQRAKQAKPLHHFPVGILRQGPKHSPIRASVYVPPYRKLKAHQASFDSASLDLGYRLKDEHWAEFSMAISETVRLCHSQAWVSLEQAMLGVVEQYYPRLGRTRRSPATITPEYWQKHRVLRYLKSLGEQAFSDYSALKQELSEDILQYKRVQQQRRRARQEHLLQEALQDKKHQSHRLSKALKKLSPWKAPERVTLRGDGGELLTATEEAEVMRDFSSRVFCKSGGLLPVQNPQRLPISSEQVLAQVKSIPIGKAVPRQSAPIAAWRSIDEEAAQCIAEKISQETGREELDTHLKDPFVSWLPKPTKAPSKPANLRPIGVLSVPAKVLAGLVRERVSTKIQYSTQSLPQYAYVKRRGTREAILHAVKHLEEAKSLASIGSRRNKLQPGRQASHGLLGSIILSIDLSRAFDSVDRSRLMQALEQLGVDSHTSILVQQLHSDTTYHMSFSGVSVAVSVTSGIKQGCKLAPILWAALTLALLQQLAQERSLSEREVSRLITLFADDFLAKGHFRNEEEFATLLGHFDALFDLLTRMGLTSNPGKSQALLQIQGTQAQTVREKYVKQTPVGKTLQVSSGIGVPIRKSLVYLGVVLSFGNYKDLTVKHRLIQASEKFRQIKHTLRSTRVLPKYKRLSIWQTYVVNSMLYGLESVGVTDFGLALLCQRFSSHIRYILGDHQIHRQHTTLEIFLHNNISGPKEQLLNRLGGLLHNLDDHANAETQPLQKELLQLAQDHFAVLSLMEEDWQLPASKIDSIDFQCKFCARQFRSWLGLLRHHKSCHSEQSSLRKGPKFDIKLGSLQGTACCSGCKRKLASIHQLQIHVESGACPNLEDLLQKRNRSAQQSMHPPHLSEVYAKRLQGADALLSSPICRSALMQHCGLCGQLIVGHKGVKQHIQQAHSSVWMQFSAQVFESMHSHKALFSKGHQCRYCSQRVDAPGRHATQCVPLLQSYLLTMTDPNQVDDERSAVSRRSYKPSQEIRNKSNPAFSLSFFNPHQLCYANSVLGLLYFCYTQTVQALNTLQAVWIAFTHRRRGPIDITKVSAVSWASRGWRLRATQEDACQYMQHLLQATDTTLATWEARVELRQYSEILVEDRGTNIVMLPSISAGNTMDVHELISNWSRREFVYALHQCQEMLLLQLPRYSYLHKDRRACPIPVEVQVPMFVDLSLATSLVSFTLAGGLLHIGEETQSGHYRHFIYDEGSAYLSDDNMLPSRIQINDPLIEVNIYILAYLRHTPDVPGRETQINWQDGGRPASGQAPIRDSATGITTQEKAGGSLSQDR